MATLTPMTMRHLRDDTRPVMHPLSDAYGMQLALTFDGSVHCQVFGPNGPVAYWWNTPTEARALASRLNEYAWRAEAKS